MAVDREQFREILKKKHKKKKIKNRGEYLWL